MDTPEKADPLTAPGSRTEETVPEEKSAEQPVTTERTEPEAPGGKPTAKEKITDKLHQTTDKIKGAVGKK